MQSSYLSEDVTLLLKDITGMVEPQPTEIREKLIQTGTHYCEMLPIEYSPSIKYINEYNKSLIYYSKSIAKAIGITARKIYNQKGSDVVLVSLARAGTPIGILIKRFLEKKYNINTKHYSISIIRGKGIDDNAMKYILQNHNPQSIQFIDGWTGKGVIKAQLKEALKAYNGVSPNLAVVADPANISEICGTHEDILIPSSCLNSTVSGLISRTFLRNDIIGKDDFHGAMYYSELKYKDVTYDFINSIEEKFDYYCTSECQEINTYGINDVNDIQAKYNISNINLIKPGIGETTRVLLRRLPWKIIVDKKHKDDTMIINLLQLAEEKKVPIEYLNMTNYKTCGIIKSHTDI